MENIKTITFNEEEINVKQYLSIKDKIDLIEIALQESKDSRGIFNELKLNAYFYLFMVYYYSDVKFTDEEKADPLGTYDKISESGLMDVILEAINSEEYNELLKAYATQIKREDSLVGSVGLAIKNAVNQLPAQMEQVADIINNFDPAKYQNVIDFATAANGGRNINTNESVVTE